MRPKTIILGIVIALLAAFSVIAFTIVEKTAPFNSYQTFTTLQINVSCGINASGIAGLAEKDSVNVTILNKSSLNGAYGIYGGVSHLLNASGVGGASHFWNQTITLTEGRHWLLCNFTNVTFQGIPSILTNVTAIEIDIDYNIITIGQDVINLSTDTGNINISGILSADAGIVSGKGIQLENSTQTADDCTTRGGELLFNGTGTATSLPTLIFCDGVSWKKINQSSS